MKITDISKDSYVMKLPVQILTDMNADFDGDILNIISLKSKELKKAYKKIFDPVDNMFISRSDGLFNESYGLLKDQIIGLRDWNVI